MKNLLFAIACLFLFNISSFAQADEFVVQIGAFETKVSMSYFKGIPNVYHTKDHNDIHKYFLGDFASMASADIKAKEVRNMGFKTRTLNLGAIARNCAAGCFVPKEIIVADVKLKSIFFDFDRSLLRTESKRQLDLLYKLLKDHPGYNAKISAHTDAKGSNLYNDKLSLRRAKSAQTYLMNRGIEESRLLTSIFGENNPIAKNEIKKGVDSETGRQYNRRVELAVYRADGQLANVVEEIKVPTQLQPEIFARKN